MSSGNGKSCIPRRFRVCPVGFECNCNPFGSRLGGTARQRAAARRKRMQTRRRLGVTIPTRTVRLQPRVRRHPMSELPIDDGLYCDRCGVRPLDGQLTAGLCVDCWDDDIDCECGRFGCGGTCDNSGPYGVPVDCDDTDTDADSSVLE